MFKLYLLIAILTELHRAALGAQLPESIKKCHFSDSKCLMNSINDVIKRYPNGVPEIGLGSMDSNRLADICLIEKPANSNSAFWLSFHIKEVLLKGLSNASITRVEGFGQDPSKTNMIIESHIPLLIHEGIYDMQARMLLFVANTTGTFRSQFEHVRLNTTIKAFLEYRRNKRHLRVYELKPYVDLEGWSTWLESLYKENTDLTIELNRVINENWLEFWNEIEPGITKMFALSFTETLNKIFDFVPYDDLFLPDKEHITDYTLV